MKLLNNILFLEFAEALECGLATEGYLRKAKSTGSKAWHFAEDPDDRRRVLVGYEKLSPDNKKKVAARFGNPYDLVARQPILDMVVADTTANEFFLSYQYDRAGVPTHLTAQQVAQSTRSSAWLTLIGKVTDTTGWKEIRKALGLKAIPEFFAHVSALVQLEAANGKSPAYTGANQLPGTFPSTYQRLREKAAAFATGGFETCLPKNLGNKAAAKVEQTEEGPALLLELLRHPNNYDDVYIAAAYNHGAAARGWATITPQAVGVWRRKNDYLIKAGREGWQAANLTYNKAVLRYRPTQPGYLWESDDNHLDLHFLGDDGKPYHRLKGIFVADSHCDLVLGYALVEGEVTPLQVRLAYLNAMHYVRSLTGGWYAPHEVKTDRWGLKALRPFYESFTHYHDAALGSKNRGWLENFFGHVDWKRCLKTDADGAPALNYTGNNITARFRGHNPEALKAAQKLFPHVNGEGDRQVAAFVHRLRHIDLKGKGSREARWLEKWAALPEAEKRPLSDMQFLAAFGLEGSAPVSITKQGIRATLLGEAVTYTVPAEHYLHNVGKKVRVLYDPFDLSRVLITDDAGLRFLAPAAVRVAGTVRDAHHQPGSRALLNRLLDEKAANVEKVTARQEADRALLSGKGIDAEALLALGPLVPKGLQQSAAESYAAQHTYAIPYNPVPDNADGAFDPGSLM